MKVGDLVTLRWGEHRRPVGMIIKDAALFAATGTGKVHKVCVQWLSTGRSTWIVGADLEKVSESR